MLAELGLLMLFQRGRQGCGDRIGHSLSQTALRNAAPAHLHARGEPPQELSGLYG